MSKQQANVKANVSLSYSKDVILIYVVITPPSICTRSTEFTFLGKSKN